MVGVRRAGSGHDKILLLHGWGGSCDSFAPVVNALAIAGFEAIAPTFPGFGDVPEPEEPWGVEEYSLWTLDFIKENGLEGCPVIAHSFGGRVTVWLASRHPGLFSKLVLVDAAGVRPKRGPKYYIKVYGYKLLKLMGKLPPFKKALEQRLQNAGSADYRALSKLMKQTFIKVVNEDLTPLLKNINESALLVWGSEDSETPLYMAKTMERLIPDAGLVVFNGAGHFSYLDEFHRFMAVLKSFLEVKAC